MTDRQAITDRVLARCRELGFALAGVCDALLSQYEPELQSWLAADKHGEMDYLARNVELRIDPRALLPSAKSIIVVADRYHDGTAEDVAPQPRFLSEGDGAARFGRIARYARGDDYHIVIKKRLHTLCNELAAQFPDEEFRACVDTAPVLEREHAQRAGLGAIGKHTLLIGKETGSWLLLGEIITTLALQPSQGWVSDTLSVSDTDHFDVCGTCTRCIDACPTQAISPWSIDAARCISYLTIEHRGPIDERYHAAMGDWVFGCDICQEVCPHNQPTQRRRTTPIHPAYRPRRSGFDLIELMEWTEESRRGAFVKSAMKRARLDMMKRNAIIAAGNRRDFEHDQVLRGALTRIADDLAESELVRATARAVLERARRTE